MFLISVDPKKQQVLGWTGSRKKLMTSQEEGLTSHTENWPGVNPESATTTTLHHLHMRRHDAAVLEPASYCMSASDPVHKYIAVRTVKTPEIMSGSQLGAVLQLQFFWLQQQPTQEAAPHPLRLSQDKHWKSRLVWSQRKTCKDEELFFTFGMTGTSSEGILSNCSH